jgi:hypothetical protein
LFHNGLGRRGRHQVDFEHERLGADRFDLSANLTQLFSATRREDDSSEVAGQPKGGGLPDARACACDDRDRFRHGLLVWFQEWKRSSVRRLSLNWKSAGGGVAR